MIRILTACAMFLALVMPAQADVDIKEVKTPAGYTAWLVEDHTIPFMALRLGFKGGASLESADKRGVTNLMMALLEEGTGDLDARGFASAVDGLAATFDFDAGDDSVTVAARMLSENRDAAMALLRGAVIEPNFEQSAIDRVRCQRYRSYGQRADTRQYRGGAQGGSGQGPGVHQRRRRHHRTRACGIDRHAS